MSRRRWGRWDGGRFPPKPAKLPPPRDGIRAHSFGTSWWGRRWIEALERISHDYESRLGRGRAYARAGRVHALEIGRGGVTALVTGSRTKPYRVGIGIAPLESVAWTKAIAAMGRKAVFAAELLAGQMPVEIDEAFRAAGATLFPVREAELTTSCTCPDWANPCKHVAAVHYVLGEAIDKDPFLLFELRGRGRARVLDALPGAHGDYAAGGARRVGKKGSAGEGARGIPSVAISKLRPEVYERPLAQSGMIRFHIEAPATRAAVLRQLGPAPSLAKNPSALMDLEFAIEAGGRLARALAVAPGPRENEPLAG